MNDVEEMREDDDEKQTKGCLIECLMKDRKKHFHWMLQQQMLTAVLFMCEESSRKSASHFTSASRDTVSRYLTTFRTGLK